MQKNSALLTDLGSRAGQYLGQILQNPRTNARLSLTVTVVLLILVTYSAASTTWTFFNTAQDMVILPTSTKQRDRPAADAGPGLSGVASMHLFGEADKSKPVSNAPIIAPETRLQLILRGVFASDDQQQSMAIIAKKGNKDKTYFKNDLLPGNASLHEIYADRVILSRNGKLETLRLLTKQADIKPDSKGRRAPAKKGSSNSRKSSSRIARMRQQLKTDRKQFLRNIRLTPVKKDDRIQGYHFRHRDPTLMRELGLQPQDVVTSVNGTPVSNMGSMMEMLRTMDSLQELNLSILRQGNPQSLTVKLN